MADNQGAKPIKNDRSTLTRKTAPSDPAQLGDEALDDISGGVPAGSYRPFARPNPRYND